MLKKISMVALLVSVCTAASAVTTFNKSVDTKLKNAVVSVNEKTNKTTDTSKTCACDTAALEGKIKEVQANVDAVKKNYPDTAELQKALDAQREEFKSLKASYENMNQKIADIQKKLGM